MSLTFNGKTYRVALFDFGGIVIEWCPAEFVNRIFSERCEKDRPYHLAEIFSTEPWTKHDQGFLTLDEAMTDILRIRQDLDVSDVQRFLHTIPFHRRVIPEGVALLQEFKSRGIPVFGATNHGQDYYDATLKEHAFYSQFDDIFVSFREGVTKPDVGFFEKLLAKFQLKPSECLFFDDVKENVEAAQEVGITGVVCEDMSHVFHLFVGNKGKGVL
jgi:HAD superfamily hydrolase (TIGR01509 family)